MSKMNDDFNEIYKRIDKFCREMFNADKGITSYIEEMKRIQDGARKIPVLK